MPVVPLDHETIIQRNKAAKNNGSLCESIAEEFLSSIFDEVEFVNKLIDFHTKDKPIEVKSCKRFYNRTDFHKPRAGRFKLEEDQHERLVNEDGFYLFIVYDYDDNQNLKPYLIRLVPARKVPFKKQIAWTSLRVFFGGDNCV